MSQGTGHELWTNGSSLAVEGGLVGIPCSLFRGGTSKGPVFLASDLPTDRTVRNRLLLAALNPDHPGQIDGIGGPETLSNKVAIVSPSQQPGADVDYTFIQITPRSTVVNDDCGTSGNFAAAVGPFALESGLVKASGDETNVRIFAVDSQMYITAKVQSPAGKVTYQGNTAISGVNGTAAPVTLTYHPPFGNLTRTFQATPTGNRCDIIDGLPVTIVDAGGTVVMIFRAESVGRTGYESKQELDADEALATQIEPVRQEVGKLIGLGDVAQNEVLGVIMIALPKGKGSVTSRKLSTIAGASARCHAAHSGSGAICLAIASALGGTVASEVAKPRQVGHQLELGIEHPSGVMNVSVAMNDPDAKDPISGVSLVRTSRKLFSGRLYAPIEALLGEGPPLG